MWRRPRAKNALWGDPRAVASAQANDAASRTLGDSSGLLRARNVEAHIQLVDQQIAQITRCAERNGWPGLTQYQLEYRRKRYNGAGWEIMRSSNGSDAELSAASVLVLLSDGQLAHGQSGSGGKPPTVNPQSVRNYLEANARMYAAGEYKLDYYLVRIAGIVGAPVLPGISNDPNYSRPRL